MTLTARQWAAQRMMPKKYGHHVPAALVRPLVLGALIIGIFGLLGTIAIIAALWCRS